MRKIMILFFFCCSALLTVYGKSGLTSSLKQEKIYIHTDKPFYLIGDTIWMKGYLVDAQTHREQDVQSRFMYVELIDYRNKVVLRKKLMEEDGIYRNFFSLESDISEGNYMLRAYTNFMRNEDEEYFYMKQIAVYESMSSLLVLKVHYEVSGGNWYAVVSLSQKSGEPYAGKQVDYMIRTKEYKNRVLQQRTNNAGEIRIKIPSRQVLSQYIELTLNDGALNITRKIDLPDVYDYDVGFYPEGGHLITGVKQIVAFKAESTTGISPRISGCVINQKGDTFASFRSEHEGIGALELMAEAGDTLSAVVCDEEGIEKKIPLPAAVSDKTALSVAQDDSLIYYRILIPRGQTLKEELELLVHVRGQIVSRSKIRESQLSGNILKNDLPEGLVHLTVFNAKEEALTERLVFVHQNEPLFQVAVFGSSSEPRSLLKMGVKLVDDNYTPLQGDFSMSVTDDYAVQPDQNDGNIRSVLLLTSDLKGKIPTPGYYLNDTTAKCKRHLDQLMLTQGWSRFKVNALLHPAEMAEAVWQPERLQVITGVLKGWFNRKTRKPVGISVAVPKYGEVNSVITDGNGAFTITHNCPDMTGFIITPSVKQNWKYTIQLNADNYPQVKPLKWQAVNHEKAPLGYLYETREGYTIIDGERVYLMPEITIQGVSPYAGYAYESVGTTFVEQQKAENVLELLNQMPEVCVYQVMKRQEVNAPGEGVPVPTGERHVGLFKREGFISDNIKREAGQSKDERRADIEQAPKDLQVEIPTHNNNQQKVNT